MYRVITSLFFFSTLMVGCASFKSAPQYGVVYKSTQQTDARCDATSDLKAVRDCVLALKNAYADRTVALDAARTNSGGLLIATAAAAAGGELFERSRDITRTSGLLGGVISSANSFAPPAALANVLQNGRSQLECALVKSDQLEAELKVAEAKFQSMDTSYDAAKDTIESVERQIAIKAHPATNFELLNQALENMERVCDSTTAAELMKTTVKVDGKSGARTMDKQAIARELYATAVSISDDVIGKYRGSYTQPTDAVKQIDSAVAKVKAALAQAQAMTDAAKLVEGAATAVAPTANCEEVDQNKDPAAANTDTANSADTAGAANAADAAGVATETAETVACAAKQNAKEVEAAATDVVNIALTAASLRACAGVQQP